MAATTARRTLHVLFNRNSSRYVRKLLSCVANFKDTWPSRILSHCAASSPHHRSCNLETMTARRLLAQQSFDSLDAMMHAYAEEAVRLAEADYGMVLDYTPESIASLETVLAASGSVSDAEQEEATRLWGAYYGEVFRRRYPDCQWIMAVYPGQYKSGQLNSGRSDAGAELSMPALDRAGSHIYPLLKIFRRLTMGPAEDLAGFYAKVAAALDAAQSQP